MAELLPDRLGVVRNPSQDMPKPEQRVISIILEWLQCSSRYIVVIPRKQLATAYTRLNGLSNTYYRIPNAIPRRSLDGIQPPILPKSCN